MKIKKELSRKQLRKAKKVEKKEKRMSSHLAKSRPHITNARQGKKMVSILKNSKAERNEEKLKFEDLSQKESVEKDSEDERIEMYEQKLKMKGKNKSMYGKIANSFGFDEDLFSFLDNISKKVPKKRNKQKQSGDLIMDKEMEEQRQSSKLNKKQVSVKNAQNNKYAPQQKMANRKEQRKEQREEPREEPLEEREATEIKKPMNSLFNKISDGNILPTLRSFINIFESHPKSQTISTFSNLFNKFNLLIQKPLIHVLSANVVLAVGIHRIYGDRVMAQILYDLTNSYEQLKEQVEDEREIEEIGYSRVFEKRKNYVTIICFLYEFGSISAEFLQSFVTELAGDMHNKDNIELIYIMIQKCGVRMRAHDTEALKEIIDTLRGGIEDSKKDGRFETTKIKFIEIQINEIRFNRKSLFNADQRMGFLHTFLNKTLANQMPAQKRTLDATYSSIRSADTNSHQWWMTADTQNRQQGKEEGNQVGNQPENQEIRNLKSLAKSYRFVTEARRNIFVELMSSQDYIEASKRLLELKVRRLEDIAVVLFEVNSKQEDGFNPFYALVAAKIAEEIPKFRVSLQFGLWDRLKQLEDYDARKISNLGKFTAWLLCCENSNASLSILKYFPDLMNLKARQSAFMQVLFKEFFKKVKNRTIMKLANKLKESKNRDIRIGIKDYLGEFKDQCNEPRILEGVKLLKKLLLMQESQEQE